MGSWYDV